MTRELSNHAQAEAHHHHGVVQRTIDHGAVERLASLNLPVHTALLPMVEWLFLIEITMVISQLIDQSQFGHGASTAEEIGEGDRIPIKSAKVAPNNSALPVRTRQSRGPIPNLTPQARSMATCEPVPPSPAPRSTHPPRPRQQTTRVGIWAKFTCCPVTRSTPSSPPPSRTELVGNVCGVETVSREQVNEGRSGLDLCGQRTSKKANCASLSTAPPNSQALESYVRRR